jgi:hypothetical protein
LSHGFFVVSWMPGSPSANSDRAAVTEMPRPAPRAASASDPLEPFMALSAEEKIALFT